MIDINSLRCKTCDFKGKLGLCKPLNDFHRYLKTRVHGQSSCYYSKAIINIEEWNASIPCAAHSSILKISFRDITDETGDF